MAIELVLCDSGTMWNRKRSAEFDARCYQKIFAVKYPDITFMPIDVESPTITDPLFRGGRRGLILHQPDFPVSNIVKVGNRNWLPVEEIRRRERSGFRILSRRNLTAYLFDEEVLEALCVANGLSWKIGRVARLRSDAMEISVTLGHEPDNWELPAPAICSEIHYELDLKGPRLGWREFVRNVLAPMLAPGTAVYNTLDRELFGPITRLASAAP